MQKELVDHSSKLDTLWAQLASKPFLSNEELRAQALAEVEEVHQRDIQRLKDQIKSLTKRE